jgi:tetratricopeptide (TPR) repeat protein
LAEARIRKNEVEPAMVLLNLAIKASLAGRWPMLTVEAYDRMGSAYYLLRRPHEAGRWFDQALNAYDEWRLTDPVLKARIYGHRANIHYVAGNPSEAIAGYQVAVATAEHVLDMQALGGIYEGLAMSFQKAGDLERALQYAQRSLRLFDTLQDVRMGAQLRNNMAEILMEQGRPAEAEALFLTGADELARVGDNHIRPHLLAGAAESALSQGRLDDSTERMREALVAAERSADPLCTIAAHRVAGRITHATGQRLVSRDHFEKALQHARRIDSPTTLSRVAYDYARSLEEQGDGATALIRYREAYEAHLTASRA